MNQSKLSSIQLNQSGISAIGNKIDNKFDDSRSLFTSQRTVEIRSAALASKGHGAKPPLIPNRNQK